MWRGSAASARAATASCCAGGLRCRPRLLHVRPRRQQHRYQQQQQRGFANRVEGRRGGSHSPTSPTLEQIGGAYSGQPTTSEGSPGIPSVLGSSVLGSRVVQLGLVGLTIAGMWALSPARQNFSHHREQRERLYEAARAERSQPRGATAMGGSAAPAVASASAAEEGHVKKLIITPEELAGRQITAARRQAANREELSRTLPTDAVRRQQLEKEFDELERWRRGDI